MILFPVFWAGCVLICLAVMDIIVILAVFTGILLFLYMLSPIISPRALNIQGSHVLITGGSSGIGKAVAIYAVKQGASVSLLARNQNRLIEAKADLEKYLKNKELQRVICISVDLCRDYHAVEKAVKQAEEQLGPVSMLVNCAGISISGRFEDTPIEDFKKQMDVNYMGSVYATRAVVPSMKKQQSGRIVFVSSQGGQIGLYGYTGYAASKWALRGMAEALQMEVKPYNIRVTIAFPPDTDTPGFATENQSKPKETRLLSETAGLFQPEYVAKVMMEDSLAGRFQSYVGTDGWMLAQVTSGMTPVTSLFEVIQQALIMGLLRLIAFFYITYFDRVISKCKVEREQMEKATESNKSK